MICVHILYGVGQTAAKKKKSKCIKAKKTTFVTIMVPSYEKKCSTEFKQQCQQTYETCKSNREKIVRSRMKSLFFFFSLLNYSQ